MHADYLTARKAQVQAEYDQVRRALAAAQQEVQQRTTQAVSLEGRLAELAFLLDQETPAVPLADVLPPGATVDDAGRGEER